VYGVLPIIATALAGLTAKGLLVNQIEIHDAPILIIRMLVLRTAPFMTI
jgi:hypothetical protein